MFCGAAPSHRLRCSFSSQTSSSMQVAESSQNLLHKDVRVSTNGTDTTLSLTSRGDVEGRSSAGTCQIHLKYYCHSSAQCHFFRKANCPFDTRIQCHMDRGRWRLAGAHILGPPEEGKVADDACECPRPRCGQASCAGVVPGCHGCGVHRCALKV